LIVPADLSVRGELLFLKLLEVREVTPCHCTGEQAIHMLKDAFGADFIWQKWTLQ